ncbi:single-stranded-DNA-specific exonuclease RecJ [Exilibacterium tricleocarpae]|uniref:Single-stranded-DNA-specific exonuclease RecJ n=1 Tax=Exilibacterium tricleocarpae TaxID=2591008 RepID=A0A545TN85_9GAMM|nr:single-stranded-DNA-specific exonuclease RecJ [Exilibacterium tricleocarpae]TQV78687.1 single-stranded-DNA-specific exonuclease RecJ [Exilibacterium tricleocarpae]
MQKIIKRRQVDLSEADFSAAIPPLLQRVYASRGIKTDAQLQNGLQQLHQPQAFKGLDAAVELLAEAVVEGRKVLIVGDFDADGATSCALAVLALRAMGLEQVDFLVPNRFEYGYGLTPEIVAVAAGLQPAVIVTVDNGISSIEGVAAAQARNIRVVVTDHHLPGPQLPAADAIVNPNQGQCGFPSKHLAGVGVIFYVMSALRAELRRRDWFAERGLAEPNMADYLDLVALGTVADVVPLDDNNRILVYQGIQRIRAGRARTGILAMLAVAGREPRRLVAADLGFVVGPRLNAAGRLDDMSLGIQCLLCDSPGLAREMALELEDLNRDRKAIESGMQREAMQSLQALQVDEAGDLPWGLCLYDATWHQGVIGILAARIKDRFHRPVIAFADADAGTIKGSARSIAGLHIRDALDAVAARHPGLLSKFGGHAMAAGMTLEKAHFDRFQAAFDAVVREQLDAADLQAELLSDGALEREDFALELAQQIREAGPWGQHFPQPLFDGEFYLQQQRLVGEKHLKLVVSLLPEDQLLIDAIAFNVDLDVWPNPAVQRARLAYRLDVNEFRGRRSVQLIVEYLEPCQVPAPAAK